MYLAMISIYNTLIENSINLTISNFILQTAIISSKVNFPKKNKTKEKTNNSPFRSNVKVSQS